MINDRTAGILESTPKAKTLETSANTRILEMRRKGGDWPRGSTRGSSRATARILTTNQKSRREIRNYQKKLT